jgi:pyocin large subunit-like protein
MRVVFLIGASIAALSLGACDAGPSATAKAPTAAASAGPPQSVGQQASALDPRDQPVPLVDGKPMWAANRKHTAQENADYQFGKNGKDFGAATEADYVAKAHAFVDAPPKGVQKVERGNGDDLLYDAKSNTFAVVTKTGAPRTMFKPHDGANYWRQQVARESAKSKGDDSSDS